MIGLDTNVLVRFLVRDDEEQFQRANALILHESQHAAGVSVSLLVLLETEWVLRSRYKLTKDEIIGAFSALRNSLDFNFEDEPSVEAAVFLWKNLNAQFADCLIASDHRGMGCTATATFDKVAVKLPGFVAARTTGTGTGPSRPQRGRRAAARPAAANPALGRSPASRSDAAGSYPKLGDNHRSISSTAIPLRAE